METARVIKLDGQTVIQFGEEWFFDPAEHGITHGHKIAMLANLMNEVEQIDACHLLGQFRSGAGVGYSGGGFTRHLIDAISSADNEHQGLVAKGFPSLVAAYRVYSHFSGGVDLLAMRAKGEI